MRHSISLLPSNSPTRTPPPTSRTCWLLVWERPCQASCSLRSIQAAAMRRMIGSEPASSTTFILLSHQQWADPGCAIYDVLHTYHISQVRGISRSQRLRFCS